MDLIFVYKIGSKCRYFISNAAHMKSNIYTYMYMKRLELFGDEPYFKWAISVTL